MIRNEEIYKRALTFRERGFTYKEIAALCDVHVTTVARWCHGSRVSKRVAKDNARKSAKENAKRLALLHKARKTARDRELKAVTEAARDAFIHLRHDPNFIAGLVLYRASGDCSSTATIRLTSQDWLAHVYWQRFLVTYLGVSREKLRFYIHLYANHDQHKLEHWWSKRISFPVERFGKTQIINQQVKRLHNGTGNTIIGSTVLKQKLHIWLLQLEKQL